MSGTSGRIIAILALGLTVCGCSKRDAGDNHTQTFDVNEPPAIAPTAAPGVAFAYDYKFLMPDDAISAVQEAHAGRCEALGVSRCRITGLRYSVGDGDAVSATLEVKLAPEIARQFGKDASAEVVRSGGRVSDTEFSGEDTAPTTAAAVGAQADAQTRINEIEKRVAATGVGDRERAQLQTQVDALRGQASDAKASLATEQAKLASTPMTFEYYGKGGVTGFNGRNPLVEAGHALVASLVGMITIVLQLLAYLLPWVLLLVLIVALLRSRAGRAVRGWVRPNSRYGEPHDVTD